MALQICQLIVDVLILIAIVAMPFVSRMAFRVRNVTDNREKTSARPKTAKANFINPLQPYDSRYTNQEGFYEPRRQTPKG